MIKTSHTLCAPLLALLTIAALVTPPARAAAGLTTTSATVAAPPPPIHDFRVGDRAFLLDGKPFVIKAAELHYTRIPRPYWEHRIQMCKALGMNTICLYIFWNIHEQEEGRFDFTGDLDVAAFVRLVRDNGMYVIVRPGPYVCAEWEMGGLPWWLLRKEGIRLREQDPYFMKCVGRFERAVAQQLSPLTAAKGGPILMVQVENEYGSYGEDRAYVAAVRDTLRAAGWDDVTLFQCDWSSNFEKNGLDDLLWTMNFGTGASIDDQFRRLQTLRPTTPLMCSEYWSGWFDGWGRAHETRDAARMVAGLGEMMQKGISFSLYMTHGGTSFGPWAGANSPGFKPDCTSYDYDAPIDETGCATPKYHELRALLAQYTDGSPLPDIPAPIAQIEIPAVTCTSMAALFDNLPQPQAARLLPMEHYGLGYGSVVYAFDLPPCDEAAVLTLDELHDYARVYINKELVGTLYRGDGENSLLVPALPDGGRMEIFVEGMGRINFGRAIKDHKGITRRVTLTPQSVTAPDRGHPNGASPSPTLLWEGREGAACEAFLLPADYAFAAGLRYAPLDTSVLASRRPYDKAGYYRATFRLDTVGDTHLDMRSWGKGFVWVNGHNLGRYWEIGPQQTLYLPGCWLRQGDNEIIILDLIGPRRAEVTGLAAPIHDDLRVGRPVTHRAAGDTLRLDGHAPIADGEFAAGGGWQTVTFRAPARGRYLCLEAIDSHDGGTACAVAECHALDGTGQRVSREPWSIPYADSEDTRSGSHTADKVFDLQESTYWTTARGAAFPHYVVIDLGRVETLSGFQCLARPEAKNPGAIRRYRLYLSEKPFQQ